MPLSSGFENIAEHMMGLITEVSAMKGLITEVSAMKEDIKFLKNQLKNSKTPLKPAVTNLPRSNNSSIHSTPAKPDTATNGGI